MVRLVYRTLLPAVLASALTSVTAYAQLSVKDLSPAVDSISRYLGTKASALAEINIDTFYIDRKGDVSVIFGKSICDFPLRDTDITLFKTILQPYFKEDAAVSLYIGKDNIGKYTSGFYSGRKYVPSAKDDRQTARPWITRLSSPEGPPAQGLTGRNIALWSGHGYYYSHTESRWKWQRAPFFSTIEDLLPYSYVVSFLAPMLENAGACVLIPRERDTRREEIIVDNGDFFYTERNGEVKGRNKWTDSPEKGFADTKESYITGENPFRLGTARMIECNLKSTSSASYLPFFHNAGKYSVYVSYQSLPKSSSALYTVRHSGGETDFVIDQRMGGGTWVYLGTFHFDKGETGQGVIVRNSAPESKGQGIITTDAVRFGGGTGNISRKGVTSGFPRYTEASRYWLQWSGFPESVYSMNDDIDDYKDDYMAKGEWVNSLKKDFHIPVDIALALHTDAGTVVNDSIIGTLAIYKEESEGKTNYTDGRPRIIARELSDIVQTSIVDDIRTYCRADWTRRAIWDRSYMEARTPDVPTVLIELLSHQNYPDMQYALDPKFKFIVSRAIYKGILKYFSYIYDTPYTVQPLPVKEFSATLQTYKEDYAEVLLEWSPQNDSSEPSAVPEAYIVYRRTCDPSDTSGCFSGFDNGTTVMGATQFKDKIKAGMLYSYKVVAINKGGASFPSEILSAGYIPGGTEALIVNGFTEVSSPASLPFCDSLTAGFDFRSSHGTPYLSDFSYIGEQYEYRRNKAWIHDDRPGFGASYMDYGPAEVAGNTFDFTSIHGLALMRNGISISSSSIGSVLNRKVMLNKFPLVDLLFGKERKGFLTDSLYTVLDPYCESGGSLIVSGENIGKTAEYDEHRHYPGTDLFNSYISSIGSAVRYLSAISDTLSALSATGKAENTEENTDLISEIKKTIDGLILFAEQSENRLNGDIESFHRDFDPDFIANRLASDILGYGWSNGNASTSGKVRSTAGSSLFSDSTFRASFNTKPNPVRYCVDSPDAILPSDENSFTFMRYETSNTSAAVAYDGEYRTVTFGFPIEALTSQQQVDSLMREVIEFLLRR